MREILFVRVALGSILILAASPCLSAEPPTTNEASKYLNAVREFADNVLKYGRDTYGPKHTPLFVDGLNIHTHEPVEWIAPNGDRWILSNLASQQNLFRTLDGLTAITGDPKYKQAAVDAIKYAFENLRSPNGFLYWGGHSAYDAMADKSCGRGIHEFKSLYPYYELMWEVNPRVTRQFIESFWSGHVLDWSNLHMDRHCYNMTQPLRRPWDYEYKEGPVFFGGHGFDMIHAASDLFYAAAWLTKLSGDQVPLVWGKRLAQRYVEARNPKTGISPLGFNAKLTSHTYDFPHPNFSNQAIWADNQYYYMPTPGVIVSPITRVWLCQLLLSETSGSAGEDFMKWAHDELTAIGKRCYDKQKNVYVPISEDGTSREGYVCADNGPLGPKGSKLMALPAIPYDFLAYAAAYRITQDKFMWDMARSIALGNRYGDIAASPTEEPHLNYDSSTADPYGLLGFLELYRASGNATVLRMAQHVADTMLAERFRKGFFVGGDNLVFSRFDAIDSLALLHLYAAAKGRTDVQIPRAWCGTSFFDCPYRHKEEVIDNMIYAQTEAFLPLSLQEAAAMGNLGLVESLIEKEIDVDGVEDTFRKTALHYASINGHREIAELLLANGADVNAKDSFPGATPLHYAADKGYKEIVELLLAKGADVDAKRGYPAGDTPLHSAARAAHSEIVELLAEKGADVNAKNEEGRTPLHLAALQGHMEIVQSLLDHGANVNAADNRGVTPLILARRRGHAEVVELWMKAAEKQKAIDEKKTIEEGPPAQISIHEAAQSGSMERIAALLKQGAAINAKDAKGMTPLLLAISGKHPEVARFLIDAGADVNTPNRQGLSPLLAAVGSGDAETVRLLLGKGANVNAKHARTGYTALHWAIMMDSEKLTKLLLAAGADVRAKGNSGETVLDVAAYGASPAIGELLAAHGAEITSLHTAAYLGDLARVQAFVDGGVAVDEKRDMSERTALYCAAAGGRTQVVDYLIGRGSRVDIQDRMGQTPLHFAAHAGHMGVVQVLLDRGADADTKDGRGRTAKDLSQEAGHTEIVDLLNKRLLTPASIDKNQPGKRTEAIDANQPTRLLFNAVKAGDIDQVKEQIANGADVNAKDSTGRMPIHYAAANNNKAITECMGALAVRPGSFEGKELEKVKRLLSEGLNANARPEAGNTLLHYAAQTGYVYVAAYLIVHGATVDVKNESGHTALDAALQWREPTMALLLLDAGAAATEKGRRDILLQAAGQTGRYGNGRARYENSNQMAGASGRSDSQHDIAISKTLAVNACIQGDVVPITVTVDNRGRQDESTKAILSDDKVVLSVRQVKLGASDRNGSEGTPDLVFDPENIGRNVFGQQVSIGGDVNGDGFGDVLIGAWGWENNRGRAYLYFGGPQMDPVADVIFTGKREGDGFANQSGVFGDVNNDGYDDVVIGAIGVANGGVHDGYVNVYFGGPHMDSIADITLYPPDAGRRGGFGFVASGDIDKDGYCDIVVGEPWSKRVSLFWGGDPMSTSTNVVFECTDNAFPFSHRMAVGGDVNGDGYNDIIIGAREGDSNTPGRAYLYCGSSKQKMDTDCDCFFRGETPRSNFGSAVDIFDIDNDGYDDVIIAARFAARGRGRVYVYWGGADFDGSEPGVVFECNDVSWMGEYLQAGHINGDLYGDILVGGWLYPGGQYRHGRAYVFCGNSKDAIDTDCDYVFEGEGRTEDWFGAKLGIGDVNNDGYPDALIGAWGANHWAGRAYLFYGPFSATTNITFSWDTTNASIGKHTLKVEIPPVPGEQNTEDNVKTVTIEVKAMEP